MQLRRYILLFIVILGTCRVYGQQGDLTQSRILILLDRSSSMVQSWAGGKEKYKAADELIMRLVDSLYNVNPNVEIALRIFGHQYTVADNNCYDTKTEVLFSKDNRTQIALRLADIRPLGVTPIAYALEQASRYDILDESRNAYCIVLITDGGESCGGNICDVMEKFLKKKLYFRPYIISLEDYAPLRATYACMGDYLQVLNHGDIAPAVGTIVNAFRPALQVGKPEDKNITGNIPSVLKVNTPPVTIKPTPPPPPRPPIEKEPVKEKIVFTKPPPNEKIPGLINERLRLFATDIAPLALHSREPGEVVIEVELPKPKEAVAPLPLAAKKQLNVIFVIEDRALAARNVPAYSVKLEPVAIPPVVVAAPQPKPVPKIPKEPKKLEYKVEVEESNETSVLIYFTDGKGKYYQSTPQVLLLDPGTNQTVKKFFRTVDESGNPDPQLHILPGRYDIAFTESRGAVDKNIEIVAGKKNKIYVTMQSTSLSFAYRDAPQRPIKEFTAVVTERNKPQGGRVQNQKCTERLIYEPGNYHVVINTFPEDVRNVDLDFNETEIEIAQPGFAKFTSADGKAHDITLWRRLGDKFEKFYLMDLRDPKNQHLQIQPGEYQVHYQTMPGKMSSAEKVVPFLVRATEETAVTLK